MEWTCEQVKARLDAAEPMRLVDCREPTEWAFNRIDGAMHVPMREIPARLGDLPRDQPILVYCHHGIRSLQVAAFLRERGFPEAWSMAGGIHPWSQRMDAQARRY